MKSVFRTIAVDPTTSNRFAFVVLEGEDHLVDWGVARVAGSDPGAFLIRLESFTAQYTPDLLAFEAEEGSRRGSRALQWLRAIPTFAAQRNIAVRRVKRRDVIATFETEGTSKWQIADALAASFPELGCQLPPRRRTWQSEDPRINIFDALAFALAAINDPGIRRSA